MARGEREPDPDRSLDGHVVLIAGASSGMGRATAHAVAAAGARVVVAARNDAALAEVAADLERAGAEALAVPTDATNRAAVERLVGAVIDRFGRLDTLVVTVGTNIPRRALSELTADSWAAMLAVNLSAAFNLTQAVVPVLRD